MKLRLILTSYLLAAAALPGAEIKVIANPAVAIAAISPEDLKGVFLATKSSVGGASVEPVMLKGGAVHQEFLKEYVGKTEAALGTYFRSLVFTGKGSMPKTLGSDSEVVAYVGKTKGAIGYVGADAATAGVKTLDVK